MARFCASHGGALHARIAEALESHFAELAERQPELLARHCTEAGMIDKAALAWGKAGQRSLDHSALIEAKEQFTRALDQIAHLPLSPELRRRQIAFQVALITPLIHVRGYTAPETRAATEQARLLIENAQALGEAPEDPLILFSVLYGVWVANAVAFNGDVLVTLAKDFLDLAERQSTTYPIVAGHSIVGYSLLVTGKIPASREHLDKAVALYDPVAHRPLASRFGHDRRAAALSHRSLAMWMLGYPEAALADANAAIEHARELDQAAKAVPGLFESVGFPAGSE
jgi:hypothetical protein